MMIKHSTFNPTLLNVEKESIVFTLLTNSNYDVLSSNVLLSHDLLEHSY